MTLTYMLLIICSKNFTYIKHVPYSTINLLLKISRFFILMYTLNSLIFIFFSYVYLKRNSLLIHLTRRDSIVLNCWLLKYYFSSNQTLVPSVNEDFFFNDSYHTNRREREKEIRIVAYLWWFKGNLDSRHASLKE